MFELIASLFVASVIAISPLPSGDVLVEKTLNLTNRQPDSWVNEVFADNIVLTLRYLEDPSFPRPANEREFDKVREPFEISFTLKPAEMFAFQNDVLPQFQGKVVKTTNGKFNLEQGFRSSGLLVGDGVCHLASFINMVAREAGLEVVAYVNHNFAPIPDIPREYGTSIFYMPGQTSTNAQQNLYVINNLNSEVAFVFKIEQDKIRLSVRGGTPGVENENLEKHQIFNF